jgi:hypothetical protein
MKKSSIYNLSKSTQHVEIGEPVNRSLTLTPGNHAWFRRGYGTRILISSRSDGQANSMFLLPSEDNVLITDSGIGSNLTTKMGKVENRATYPIFVSGGTGGTVVPSGTVRSFLFTKGEVWNISNSAGASARATQGKFKVESPNETIVFDGISAYVRR